MKRRITVEQLNDLPSKQMQKLRTWCNPQYCACTNQYYASLDIAQMIELLGKEKTARAINRNWHDNELCDVLWEAVKALLYECVEVKEEGK